MTAALRANGIVGQPGAHSSIGGAASGAQAARREQIDNLDHLPEHPQPPASLETPDPIAAIIEGDNAFPAADGGRQQPNDDASNSRLRPRRPARRRATARSRGIGGWCRSCSMGAT